MKHMDIPRNTSLTRPRYLRAPNTRSKNERPVITGDQILGIIFWGLACAVVFLFMSVLKGHYAHAADITYSGVTDGSTVVKMDEFCSGVRETHSALHEPLTGDLLKYCGK